MNDIKTPRRHTGERVLLEPLGEGNQTHQVKSGKKRSRSADTLADIDSGDRIVMPDGRSFRVSKERKITYPDGFCIFFNGGLDRIRAAGLSPSEFNSLLWMITVLSFDGWKSLKHVHLQEAMECSQPQASRIIAKLVKVGFLERRGEREHARYRINADIGWRGTVGKWYAHQRDRNRKSSKSPNGETANAEED